MPSVIDGMNRPMPLVVDELAMQELQRNTGQHLGRRPRVDILINERRINNDD